MEGKMVSIVVILQLLIILVAAVEKDYTPVRPVIPNSFHARVRATLVNSSMPSSTSQNSWLGGGYFALDVDRGFHSVQLHMKPKGLNRGSDVHIHTLDRYDMDSAFTIYYNRTCVRKDVEKGKVAHPFEWVKQASFTGVTKYNGQMLENWEYVDENKALFKVAVKKGTNKPVVIVLGNKIVSTPGLKLELVVLEWDKQVRPRILSFVPLSCGAHDDAHLLGDVDAVVAFADQNWNCADVACDQTVPAGSGQPDYACAEFTARALAAGGFIPGLGPYDDQGSYSGYSYGGNTYSLIDTTGLSPALTALGFTTESNDASSVTAACSAIGDGGDGYFSHAVIGVGPGIDDAHNNARFHYDVADSLYGGINAVQCAPGVTPPSSGSYYSYKDDKSTNEDIGGKGEAVYTKEPKSEVSESIIEDNAGVEGVRLVEEKASKKF